MNKLFEIVSVFIISATFGWLLEVCYRSYKLKHMVNPGFLFGPCLPLYGTGGVILYLLCSIDLSFIQSKSWQIIFLLIVATILMTAIEYIAGIISLKVFHNRLWDYSNRWGNIQGIICPLFSLIWGIICVMFYFFVFPWLSELAVVLSKNTITILLMGVYLGVFFVDLFNSLNVLTIVRSYAIKFKQSINFENFKHEIANNYKTRKGHSLSGYSFNLYSKIKKFVEEFKSEKTNSSQDKESYLKSDTHQSEITKK